MLQEKNSNDWFVCPNCGADVRGDALACRECGSDENTGWAPDADKWEAGIPAGYGEDDEFDYDEFITKEFSDRAKDGSGIPFDVFLFIALVIIALFVLYMISSWV